MSATLSKARRALFRSLGSRVLFFAEHSVGKGATKTTVRAASNADQSNRASLELSNFVVGRITGKTATKIKPAGQTLGDLFEKAIADYLRTTFLSLAHLRPGRWEVVHVTNRTDSAVSGCEQYSHLNDLAEFCRGHRELAAALGNDYAISPDILISRQPEPDDAIDQGGAFLAAGCAERSPLRKVVNPRPLLHACVSCKFTLRSDRSQNARAEALNLIRNRKGRVPHIVIVTAECLPSRLASLALGTGDIDCLYHIALPELIQAVEILDYPDARDMLEVMVAGRRIRDISDLPLDLTV